MNVKSANITVIVSEMVPGSWIALAKCAGVVSRSQRYTDPVNACLGALTALFNGSDGEFAIALALEGVTIENLNNQMTTALSESTSDTEQGK